MRAMLGLAAILLATWAPVAAAADSTTATARAADSLRPPAPLIGGLDHVPIAVRDLAGAARDYRRLGFALKPGRPHDNGIQNRHVKFRDGTELELITAPEARDPLTDYYRRHLAAGEGPAFVAFYAPDADSLVEQLEDFHRPYRAGTLVTFPDEDSLRYVFFGKRNRTPDDRPEHFAHPNGSESLVEVWLASDDFSAELALMSHLRVSAAREAEAHAPDPQRARVIELPEGRIRLLPGDRQIVPGRRVVGATLRVKSLAATRRVLAKGLANAPPVVETGAGSSVFLPPSVTHGIWLEFREPRRDRGR